MDLQYGIAVTNKFALFEDEDVDPLEILRQKEEESKNAVPAKKDKKKTSAKKAAAEIKPKQQEQLFKKDDAIQTRQTNRGGRGGRGRELRENDGSRPPRRQGPRENRDFRGDENVPPEFRERGGNASYRDNAGGFERGRGGRGGGFRGSRGRGLGGGRGGPRPESGRGGFGGPGGDRRQFDRHSSSDKTGVKPTEKRDGSGAHNWGSYKDDVEEQQAPNQAETSAEAPAEDAENPQTEAGEGGEAPVPKEDEEPKEMTLDEWKALQNQTRPKSQFNIRRAGEGCDDKQWKKGVAYKKKNDDEEDESEEEEEEEEEHHGNRKQLVTDIRITFADNPRRGGRGARGGRGGPRGGPRGGGRGGPAGGDRDYREPRERPARGGPRETAPRMDNELDFPALVKSEN